MRIGPFVSVVTAGCIAACSLDTSQIRANGSSDVGSETSTLDAITADIASDAPPDTSESSADESTDAVVADVVDTMPPPDAATRTLVGTWRVTGVEFTNGMTTVMLPNGAGTSCNGLATITSSTLSFSLAVTFVGRVTLSSQGAVCPNSRVLSASGFGWDGVLDDAGNQFSIMASGFVTVIHFTWDTNDPDAVSASLPPDASGSTTTIHLHRPVALNGSATTYRSSAVIQHGGAPCSNVPALTHGSVALLWENPTHMPQAIVGPISPLNVGGAGVWSYSATLAAAPPAQARALIGSVSMAVAYVVVFDDANNNGAFDNPLVAAGSSDAGSTSDPVWGISNLGLVWRGPGTPDSTFHSSSFVDTYPGYQLVTFGPDFRSDGGTAPWVLQAAGVPGVGAFPTDPTTSTPSDPLSLDGLVQTAPTTSDLPRLLR